MFSSAKNYGQTYMKAGRQSTWVWAKPNGISTNFRIRQITKFMALLLTNLPTIHNLNSSINKYSSPCSMILAINWGLHIKAQSRTEIFTWTRKCPDDFLRLCSPPLKGKQGLNSLLDFSRYKWFFSVNHLRDERVPSILCFHVGLHSNNKNSWHLHGFLQLTRQVNTHFLKSSSRGEENP